MLPERTPPIIIPPSIPPNNPAESSAIIFIHGLGDDATGIESIVRHFQSARKLPHMTWVLPNALENHDLGATAWYLPTRLSSYPSSRPELEDEEDEQGIMVTIDYITSLIDDLVVQGIPEKRIIVGGFSQGHAIALLTGLISKYSERLGGLFGLSGYLPLSDRIPTLREKAGLPKELRGEVDTFLARGTGDRLVSKRRHRLCHERLFELGIKEEKMTIKEYEGMGHVMSGTELRDLCAWLERVLPEVN